jgi:hypothetical protein
MYGSTLGNLPEGVAPDNLLSRKDTHTRRQGDKMQPRGNEVASASSYYQWRVPGQAVAVSLSLDVAEWLGRAVLDAGEPSSQRRPEIGGFLLGTVKRIRGETVVEVDGFEPLECEHAFGASYFLSREDQQRLAARVRLRRQAGASIVGFFRSNTRKEFALAIEDLDLMATYFSKPKMVMLVVHASPAGALKGGFFLWEQRAIRTMTPYLEFPFDAGALVNGDYDVSRRPSELAGDKVRRKTGPVSVQWPSLRTAANAVPQAWAKSLGRFKLEWLVAMAALGIAGLGGSLYRGPRGADAAPAVRMHSNSSSAPTLQRDDSPRPSPFSVAAIPDETPLDVDSAPVLAPQSAAASPEMPSETEKHGPRAASRIAAISAAPEVAAVVSVPPLPTAPSVTMELPEAPEPLMNVNGLPATVPPDIPDPFVTFAVEPMPVGHPGRIGRLFSHRNEHRATTFVPPRLIQQRSPDVPPELRRQIQDKTVPITVKLYVGRAGKVDYAELLSDATGANRDLATLALFASRKFQFSPAQEGNETVPAEVVVRFQFGARSNR